MEQPKAATMRHAQEAFAAWKTVNDQITSLEGVLQRHDPSRDAPVADLKTELRAHRVEAERLLMVAQHVLLTIKTPRSSNGDSTWG